MDVPWPAAFILFGPASGDGTLALPAGEITASGGWRNHRLGGTH